MIPAPRPHGARPLRSANPALSARTFRDISRGVDDRPMTLDGVVTRAAWLLVLVLGSALATWMLVPNPLGVLPFAGIGGLAVAVITIFAKRAAFVTAPLYAVCEGLSLGAISVVTDSMYPGIAGEAVGLTLGVFASLLFLYRTRIVQPSENLKLGVMAGTMGLARTACGL